MKYLTVPRVLEATQVDAGLVPIGDTIGINGGPISWAPGGWGFNPHEPT